MEPTVTASMPAADSTQRASASKSLNFALKSTAAWKTGASCLPSLFHGRSDQTRTLSDDHQVTGPASLS